MNPANPKAHFETTGPEIWRRHRRRGGHLRGGRGHRRHHHRRGRVPQVQEARRSRWWPWSLRPLPCCPRVRRALIRFRASARALFPRCWTPSVYDEIIPVANEDAFAVGKQIGKAEGVLVGISSGAAVMGGHRAGQAAGKRGQDHRRPPAGHRRPVSVHAAVRGLTP